MLTFGVASLQKETGLHEVSHDRCEIPKLPDKKLMRLKKHP